MKPNVDPKFAEYEDIANKKKIQIEKILETLEQLREEIAEKLVSQVKFYNNKCRAEIDALTKQEEQLQNDLYRLREEHADAVRKWRVRLVTILSLENFQGVTKSYHGGPLLRENPDSTKALTWAPSESTELSWTLLVRRDAIRKYNVKLGQGAFGKVYKGIVHGTQVAIKELNQPLQGEKRVLDSATLQNFEKECKLLRDIVHPNILKFMGACLDHNYYCLLTEVAENGSLYDVLYPKAREVPLKLSEYRKMTIIEEIVSGMRYLHQMQPQVLHLDLKSANILLDEDWHVRIGDFGMSKIKFADFLTTSFCGTPYYMAPEVLLHNSLDKVSLTPQTDVFSFGILVNELLTEQRPYQMVLGAKPSLEDLVKVVMGGEEEGKNRPLLVKNYRELRDMITSCWATEPIKRPTFDALDKTKAWEKAKTNVSSNTDPLGEALVKVFDSGTDKVVSFAAFVNHVKTVYSLEGLLNLTDSRDVNVRALKAIMDIGNTQQVSFEKVERFNLWFCGVKKKELINTMDAICSKPWFWGAADDAETNHTLSSVGNNRPGTYLVRWHNKQFILNFVYREKKRSAKTMKIHTVNLGTMNVVALSSLVTKKIRELHLTTPAQGRPVCYAGLGLETTKFYTAGGTLYGFAGQDNANMADLTSVGPVNFIL